MHTSMRNPVIVFLLFVVVSAALVAQTPTAATPSANTSGFVPKFPGVTPDDILPETQFSIPVEGYVGLVWWIPTEFWEVSAQSRGVHAGKDFQPLEEYTTVAIFFGKVGTFGNFQFATAEDLRKNFVLRDAAGNEYSSIRKVSPEAEGLANLLKPMLANAMGKMGESMELLYFPAKSKDGKPIATPMQNGQFSFVLRDTLGLKEAVTLVNTPLTSLSPAKYCPVDHRKMSASWTFCPWHGIALDTKTAPATAAK
jgi:hypothetical protein